MNLLSSIISLCCSFWMIIYLYGLKSTHSAKYNPSFYLFSIVLLSISVYCFYLYLKDQGKI
ncbi:MAG: hypothetical protein FH761_15685 [Firmicutes bacterium]|nr:hypothetical protein [Bacillota bacterium]